MSVFEMWKGTLTIKILLIFVGFLIFLTGVVPLWIGAGLVMLAGGCFLSFRQGQGAGHEACSVSKSVERAQQEGHAQLDAKIRREAWSVSNGIRAIFAGGLVGYVVNAIYIIITLAGANEYATLMSRLASMVVSIPYMPIVANWHQVLDAETGKMVVELYKLTPDMIVVFMVGPFLLPLFQFLGYLQGPKLWQKTEKAMAEGKRRAKARSRIVKKKGPKVQKPEI